MLNYLFTHQVVIEILRALPDGIGWRPKAVMAGLTGWWPQTSENDYTM